MDVRRQAIRFIERTHTNEADSVAGSSVVAPNSDAALRTAGNLLALATVGRCVDDLNFSLEHLHTIRFNQRVQGKRCARLPLAPTAVTAMDEQRSCRHAIAHETAGAAAVEESRFDAHGSILIEYLTVERKGLRMRGFSSVSTPLSTISTPPLYLIHRLRISLLFLRHETA